MKRITVAILLLTISTGLIGCTSMCDCVISCEMSIRNHVLANKAWGHWSWCYDDLDYPYHFAKGFKAGYEDILSGGSGCQPTLPPQCYWKPCYQTPEGHCKTHAWFDGFSHGALAAQQDGYGSLGEIPISPTARANMELAQQPRTTESFYLEEANAETPLELPGGSATDLPPVDGDPADNLPFEISPTPIQPVPARPYE